MLSGHLELNNATIAWNLSTDETQAGLRLVGVPSPDRNNFVLSWINGAGIRLQETKSLSNPVWQDIRNSGGTNTMAFPALDKTGFFRLAKP